MQPDPIGYGGGVNLYAYVNNDPLNATDPLGLYSTLVVTLPNGTQYTPMTTVKNSAQAAATSYGVPVGTNVPIAVPPGVNPQTMVNQWGSGSLFNGPAEFAYTWRPNGPNDYKQQNPMYDAYGNFLYGATGQAAGFSSGFLQTTANLLHGGTNNPINTTDIQSGFDAIANGGQLSIEEYTPPPNPNQPTSQSTDGGRT